MQRVVSINLNGNAYQIEENGYDALFAYLDATDAAFKDHPDRAQKLADLERVVAEKCQACLGPHKTVVTSAEIDRIILELGPIPGQPAANAAPPPNSATGSTSTSTPGSTHRRLYQIRDGAMFSGVCVGLSEFLHIDVTIIRILFVVFALASAGWGILAYGVLMFVVPKVGTRAEASGGTATGTRPYEWPWDTHGWPWDKHGWPWDQPGWDANAKRDWKEASRQFGEHWRDQGRDWRDQQRAARMAHGPHVFGTMTMIIFLMIGFFWLSFWSRGHFFFGWPFFWGVPHWVGIIFFFLMLRLIFMPFRMARWHAYGPYGPHPHDAWVSMWNGLLWFLVMIFVLWAASHYVHMHDFNV